MWRGSRVGLVQLTPPVYHFVAAKNGRQFRFLVANHVCGLKCSLLQSLKFVAAKPGVLLPQSFLVCGDNEMTLSTQICVCSDKHAAVAKRATLHRPHFLSLQLSNLSGRNERHYSPTLSTMPHEPQLRIMEAPDACLFVSLLNV